jgi:hypothetical protein
MMTVGFGDLVPSSGSARLTAPLYMLVSVSLYVSFITFFELRARQLIERLT